MGVVYQFPRRRRWDRLAYVIAIPLFAVAGVLAARTAEPFRALGYIFAFGGVGAGLVAYLSTRRRP